MTADSTSIARHDELEPLAVQAFGRYALVARLGRGGMADALLAVAVGAAGFRKLVVIKRLRDHLAGEADIKTMFMDEARLAARLNHGNVVQALEVGEVDGQPFLAMEHLDGQPLLRILGTAEELGRPIPTALTLYIISEVLEGLHHAHDLRDFDGTPLNVVHRDVSPANVMLTYDGRVKLIDFGIAKSATQTSHTAPGFRKGKFSYIAPEQIEGGLDRRVDVWATGVLLWEALAARRLFLADSHADTLERVLHMPIPGLPATGKPPRPRGVDAIVRRALERDPDRRYQDAGAMRAHLDQVRKTPGAGAGPAELSRFLAALYGSTRHRHEAAMKPRYARGLAVAATIYDRMSSTPPSPERDPTEATHPLIPASAAPTTARLRGRPPGSLMVLGATLLMTCAGVAATSLAVQRWWNGGAHGRVGEVQSGPAPAAAAAPEGVADPGDGSPGDVAPSRQVAAMSDDAARAERRPTAATASPASQRATPRLVEAFATARADGRLHFAAGRYRAAAAAYERATALNPDHPGCFAGLGAARLAAGDATGAIIAYREAIRRAPVHSGYHAALGRAYRAAGQSDLAAAAYREAVRLDRGNQAAREALADLRGMPQNP